MTQRKRFKILRRDNFKCRYCGHRGSETELHVDHVVPRSRGGDDHSINLVASCVPCNLAKSDLPFDGAEVSEIYRKSLALEPYSLDELKSAPFPRQITAAYTLGQLKEHLRLLQSRIDRRLDEKYQCQRLIDRLSSVANSDNEITCDLMAKLDERAA